MENLVSLCHQRLKATGPPVLLPSVKNRTGARTLQLSSTPKLCKVADGDAPHTAQACHVSKQMFPQETALMTTRLCRCTTPSRHRAPKTLHNSVKHDKGRGRWGNILAARTTPAPSWRFPACGDPVAGAGPSSRSASSPRRHGPTPINTGESRSIVNRGFSRRHQLQSRITAHRQQDQFTTE